MTEYELSEIEFDYLVKMNTVEDKEQYLCSIIKISRMILSFKFIL